MTTTASGAIGARMTADSPGALAPFFAPRTVAVIGASRSPAKVSGAVLANLVAGGFAGRIVPVNCAAAVVQGLPAAKSVGDVDGPIDLAVIAVPSQHVLDALEACAAKGVGAAVVISAGFREIGGAGAVREAELRAWLAARPLRLLGPNCLGWIRPSHRLNLTFAPDMPRAGTIAFVSHSGALAVALLDWARELDLGFSLFASLGNQADLTETDVLLAATDDPETRVIAAYIEGVPDGRRFLTALPDLQEEDIAGSGFAITGYCVQPGMGGDAARARLRERFGSVGSGPRRAMPQVGARAPHR